MSIIDAASRAGSIFVRVVADPLGVTDAELHTDFFYETVLDPLGVTDDPGTGPLDLKPIAVTDPMTISDSFTKTGGSIFWDPEAIFDSTTSAGMALYVSGSGTVDLADADNATTAICIGLALTDVASSGTGEYRSQGELTLVDWTAVTGGASLTAGVVYYLSTTDGQLTSTPPTGTSNHITRVGLAVTTKTISLEIARPLKLA